MRENKDYFELGRGAKLISNEYWRQYVLGLDLSKRQFIAMEVGKTEILYRTELSINDLARRKWTELLETSKTKSIVEKLIKDTKKTNHTLNNFYESVFEIIAKKELIAGDWISTDEYDNLNYNSNFGNWVDASERKGRLDFHFDPEKESENCSVEIPVNYSSIGEGYYSIIQGTFQLGYTQILVWQNEIFPVVIAYELKENILTLGLFKNKIEFNKR